MGEGESKSSGGSRTWYDIFGRYFGNTHTHTQTHILFDPIIILLGIYPVSYRIRTNTLLVALFIIAKNWKQPTCPSVGYRLN